MGDIVSLRSIPVDINSDVGRQFVIDACRAGEGLIDDRELTEIYGLSPKDWQDIQKNVELGRAIRAERDRRVRRGTAVSEAAAKHLVKSTTILEQIMTSADSPRAKIEAIRELRQAAVGDNTEHPAERDRFIITINLGDESKTYNKSIKPDTPVEDGPNNLIPLEGKPDDQW